MLRKIAFLIAFCSSTALAQTKSAYNAYELFHPLWNYGPVSSARTGAGIPSSTYWQNSVDYKISASIAMAKNGFLLSN
jgi:hypothetical protein